MPRRLPALSSLILIVTAATTACSGPANTPTITPASTSRAATVTASPADDPPGTLACARAARTLREGTVMDPGVVTDITTAAATADAPILEAAQALATSYTDAVAAQGTAAEPDAIAAVSAAAAELTRICAAAGLEVVG
jgi:hypothetical protein